MTPLDFPDAPAPDEVFTTPKTSFTWKVTPDRWWRGAPVSTSMTLTSMVPDNADVLQTPLVEFNGTGFTPTSVINFGVDVLISTYVSPTQLTATLPSIANPQAVPVLVVDGSKNSNVLPFTLKPRRPYINFLVPDSTLVNSADTPVRVIGTDFYSNSVVQLDGVAVPTTYLSPTELEYMAPPSANVVTVEVRVFTDTRQSNDLYANYRRAVIHQLWPGYVYNNIPNQVVTLQGVGFVPNAVVQVAGVGDVPTTFISDTALTMVLVNVFTFSSAAVTVFQDGYTINSLSLKGTATPPDVTQLIPDTLPINNATTVIRVLGNLFPVPTNLLAPEILFNGVAVPTTFISNTELQATAPPRGSPGIVQVGVLTDGTYSATTLPLTYV